MAINIHSASGAVEGRQIYFTCSDSRGAELGELRWLRNIVCHASSGAVYTIALGVLQAGPDGDDARSLIVVAIVPARCVVGNQCSAYDVSVRVQEGRIASPEDPIRRGTSARRS